MVKIKLYTKSYCPFCHRAIEILKNLNVDFENFEVNTMQNGEEIYEKIKEKTGHQTVPQIFINDKFIGGCDELEELNESGELKELIGS